ncbi:MAG: hypothetical protein HYS65_10790 [Betaproteobacteria bacterium]|nr:hypothetical protein [Betaproteobacteria bacterium]MBI2288993.1 hypothetical protein [Betaproteobacteria bacterium]MBI3053581.1 hypothetical protein [Betaproteobacteria bacterium]
MARIQEKIKKGETKEITEASGDNEEEPRSTNVIDLAALLKKSLDSGGRRPKPGAKPNLQVIDAQSGSKTAAKRKHA